MKKEALKLDNVKRDLEMSLRFYASVLFDRHLDPVIGCVIIGAMLGFVFQRFWVALLPSPYAIYHLCRYIPKYRKHRKKVAYLKDSLRHRKLNISVKTLSSVQTRTIYEPHSGRKYRHALKDATFFHFTCGTTWRVPTFAKYYDWSHEFYLSFEGLQNIAVKDNEYFYIALKDHPDIAFTYPAKFFTLGEELENIMIYV